MAFSGLAMSDAPRRNLTDPYRLTGTVINGKYRLDAVLGIGGMGIVYLAEHLGINRKLALKVLKPDVAAADAAIAEAFHREAKISGRLSHPNIISVTDADTLPDGTPFIAMELLECPTLEDELQRSKRLPLDRVERLLSQICDALHYAHRAGLVHRDLKPANIGLVGAGQPSEQVKILDFGIAKSLDEGVGKVSQAIGTPLYASPEQFIHGGDIDGRADLYSLAVIVYRMLTGALPFQGKTVGEIVSLHLTAPPPPMRAQAPELTEPMEAFVLGALAKQPTGRPATALDFLAGFQAARRGVIVGEDSLPLLGSGTDLIAGVLESSAPPTPGALPATLSPVGQTQAGNVTTIRGAPSRPAGLPPTLPSAGPPQGQALPETTSRQFIRPASPAAPRLGVPVWSVALAACLAVGLLLAAGAAYLMTRSTGATSDAPSAPASASPVAGDDAGANIRAYRERLDRVSRQAREALDGIVQDNREDPLLQELRDIARFNPATIEARWREVENAESQVAQVASAWSAVTPPDAYAADHRALSERYQQLRDALHNYGVSIRNLGNALARTDFDMSQPRERFAESEREDLRRDRLLLESAWRDARRAEAALRDR
ncbi:MAG: hypothetical protein CFK52_12740 [Chloracidobacterium sp. CP2_5A]|nr:MAG: hypothetical protein CFK52_12740 [Chloracidobacterium sp. CP2_5A]